MKGSRKIRRMAKASTALSGGRMGLMEYLEGKRDRYQADTRQANYEVIEAAAYVVIRLRRRPRLLRRLLRHNFFKLMRGQHPKEAHKAVMQFALRATTENQRKRANRFGRAIDILLGSGVRVKCIATRLACSGGVQAVFDQAKPVSSRASTHADFAGVTTPLRHLETTGAQDDEAELEGINVDADDVDASADSELDDDQELVSEDPENVDGERPAHLVIKCDAADLEAILHARRSVLTVNVERARDWQRVSLVTHRILS